MNKRQQQFDRAQREAQARDQHIADYIATRSATPLYQDPQRAESAAWAAAYPEPNREEPIVNHAQLADMEAAIARDEATNPDAYYEYEGTIDEAHARTKLTAPDHCARCWADPATDFDRTAFLAPDGKWTTVAAPSDAETLPTGGPAVNYGAAGI